MRDGMGEEQKTGVGKGGEERKKRLASKERLDRKNARPVRKIAVHLQG
jgi:hypothetical protein